MENKQALESGKFLIAFDKLKGALTALEACDIARSVVREIPGTNDELITCLPLTDGGEGFVQILAKSVNAPVVHRQVIGPLGDFIAGDLSEIPLTSIPRECLSLVKHLEVTDKITVLDLASVSGYEKVADIFRDPWKTGTWGLGDILNAAMEKQPDLIVLGLGGSATNDLGLGALYRLGARFLDRRGELVLPVPENWEQITEINLQSISGMAPILIACDVDNPLLGKRGATSVFGPQKGLKEEDADRFEALMSHLARLLIDASTDGESPDYSATDFPGCGAAGGVAFCLQQVYGAELISGAAWVDSWLGVNRHLEDSDYVITGEGRFDRSSLDGKGPYQLLKKAVELGKSARCFCGSVDPAAEKEFFQRFPSADIRFIAISPENMPLNEALRSASPLLRQALTDHLGRSKL